MSEHQAHPGPASVLRPTWFEIDLDDIMDRFNTVGVTAGPIYDIRDIFAGPHYAARQAIVEAPDADFGGVRMQGVVPRMGATPGRVTHRADRPARTTTQSTARSSDCRRPSAGDSPRSA